MWNHKECTFRNVSPKEFAAMRDTTNNFPNGKVFLFTFEDQPNFLEFSGELSTIERGFFKLNFQDKQPKINEIFPSIKRRNQTDEMFPNAEKKIRISEMEYQKKQLSIQNFFKFKDNERKEELMCRII